MQQLSHRSLCCVLLVELSFEVCHLSCVLLIVLVTEQTTTSMMIFQLCLPLFKQRFESFVVPQFSIFDMFSYFLRDRNGVTTTKTWFSKGPHMIDTTDYLRYALPRGTSSYVFLLKKIQREAKSSWRWWRISYYSRISFGICRSSISQQLCQLYVVMSGRTIFKIILFRLRWETDTC